MSVRFGSIKDLLYRSQAFGDTIPQQDPLTACGWLYVYANIHNAGPLFARYANATGTERSGAYVDVTGISVLVEATASTGSWSRAHPLTLRAWQFWAYRRIGSTQELLLDGVVVSTVRGAPASDTSAAFVFGCTSTEYVDGQFARWRIWPSALTDAEVLAEKHAAKAVKGGAWADYPMARGDWATDISGNGRRLRTAGALSNGTSEPLAVLAQPAPQTVAVGATATFTVVAAGAGMTYQWQDDRNGAFGNVSGGSGSNTASYTTAAVGPAFQGRQYRVIVADASGATASAVARVGVLGLSGSAGASAAPRFDEGWPRRPTTVSAIAALALAAGLAAVTRRRELTSAARLGSTSARAKRNSTGNKR
ncbi:MAG: LamG-like jellyroll fold domain-containing protein [Burkholderiales bacterium]